MEIHNCKGLVLHVPEFFEDKAFMAWLNDKSKIKLTWHQGGRAGDFSDTVVCVDPALTGEGSDSDMPEHIWEKIMEACKSQFKPNQTDYHIMVRLVNI